MWDPHFACKSGTPIGTTSWKQSGRNRGCQNLQIPAIDAVFARIQLKNAGKTPGDAGVSNTCNHRIATTAKVGSARLPMISYGMR